MADRYSIDKGELLDARSDANLAVRLALGETHVIHETKEYLKKEGVDLDVLVLHSNKRVLRSATTFLVKNLPYNTTFSELRKLFGKYGELGRILLPPSKAIALVEYVNENDAKRAFRELSFSRFHHVPLFLEWAPQMVFTSVLQDSSDSVKDSSSIKEESVADQMTATQQKTKEPKGASEMDAEDVEKSKSSIKSKLVTDLEKEEIENTDLPTLFVKNLNFETTEKDMRAFVLRHLPSSNPKALRSCKIATKKDKKGKVLSLGYGFLEFFDREVAIHVIKSMQNKQLDGHALELKFSHSQKRPESDSKKKKSSSAVPTKPASPKLLIRNLAFEATKAEITTLFGYLVSLYNRIGVFVFL